MESAASTLTRSVSLSAPRLRRSSTTVRARSASPRAGPLFSSAAAAASPRALPLRRTRSDAALAVRTAAVLLRGSPIPAIFEADEEDDLGGGGGGGRNGGGQSGGGGGGGSGGGGGGGSESGCGMGEHFRRVLRLDPENPLLLRNYGKYLHEVEGDLAGAEGCYARALLASPGDADLLSLYGRVIWEARQEKDRAADYFERAVQAAPDDCYVLGSYASFLWEAEEDDDEAAVPSASGSPALVPAC
ncbi:hypothetical protein ACP70R_020807 [Stipagrostis hirtigluma subsp. patula]